jgi:hypothetical protein
MLAGDRKGDTSLKHAEELLRKYGALRAVERSHGQN